VNLDRQRRALATRAGHFPPRLLAPDGDTLRALRASLSAAQRAVNPQPAPGLVQRVARSVLDLTGL
jgi:hypothetical protein